jgi:hypothetical protein
VSCKRQELLPFTRTWVHPRGLMASVLIFLVFCVVFLWFVVIVLCLVFSMLSSSCVLRSQCCHRHVSCVLNVVIVMCLVFSMLSSSCVLCSQCCQCLKIYCPFGFLYCLFTLRLLHVKRYNIHKFILEVFLLRTFYS